MRIKDFFTGILALAFITAIPSCKDNNNDSSTTQLENSEQADEAIRKETTSFLKERAKELKPMWDNKVFTYKETTMPIKVKVFGEKPADGRSLFISMHGGGNTAKEVNDQQWENQIRLYTPEEGVYVAPRAPFDDWNMWFRPQLDPLFEQLILAAVCEMDVNPDKVYLLGYSAGGDGVWRMAPRMADRWAASSMMAGHPGESSMLNLRNVPFMIWMGENDSAYNRNSLAVKKGAEIDQLHEADTAGYIHETHIVEGKGHWMDNVDKYAVEWMPQFKRNPFPEKIVWRQEEVTRTSFYWLEANADEVRHGMIVKASHQGNTFTIEQCDYANITLCLNDQFVDLEQPIIVNYAGQKIFEGKVTRKLENIRQSLSQRQDIRLVFTAKLPLNLKK